MDKVEAFVKTISTLHRSIGWGDDGDDEDNGDDVEDDDHLVLVDGFLLSLSSSLTLRPIKLLGPVARVARELREELLTKIIVNIDKLHNLFCWQRRSCSIIVIFVTFLGFLCLRHNPSKLPNSQKIQSKKLGRNKAGQWAHIPPHLWTVLPPGCSPVSDSSLHNVSRTYVLKSHFKNCFLNRTCHQEPFDFCFSIKIRDNSTIMNW